MNFTSYLPFILIGTLTAQEVSSTRVTLLAPVISEPTKEKPPEPVLQLDIAPESVIESKTVTADGQRSPYKKSPHHPAAFAGTKT